MNKFKTKNRDWSSFPLAPISEDCGIYIIRNLINGSCYIGSSKNISKRIRYHIRQKGSVSVAAAINKYGLENFAAYMLQPCPLEFRFKVETFWIELVEPEYNRVVFADGVISYTEESRAKMRKSWETRPPVSEETKRRQSAAHKGRKMSPEAIEKSVSKRRGLKFSEETKAKMSAAHRLENLTPETRKRMSEAQKGKVRSRESIDKATAKIKGLKRTPEQKQNYRTSAIRRWSNPEEREKAIKRATLARSAKFQNAPTTDIEQ